ncbi:hypothetical protein A3K72_01915 [Candidatus Woesearchaeota archaeon RBG_13_36_6]|nr:MAG: hypothetical protein A3K72_01915 [Candidatus Woesearchaeota archaeon RBG_13_36_6]
MNVDVSSIGDLANSIPSLLSLPKKILIFTASAFYRFFLMIPDPIKYMIYTIIIILFFMLAVWFWFNRDTWLEVV